METALCPAKLYLNHQFPEYLTAGRRWQGIPSMEKTAGGRLFFTWYSGGVTEEPGNVVVLEKSDDDGGTLSDGLLLVKHDDPEVRCFDPTVWIDPMGRLWLFWTQSKSYFDGRDGVWTARCDDPDGDALCFTAPRRIADGLMLNKPTVRKNGDWLFPIALWSEVFIKPGEDHPELRDQTLANLYLSRDGGESFTRVGGVDMPRRAFDEHMAVELSDGRLWMLVRTRDGIGQAFSSDGGATWENIGFSGHTGPNSRFFIRRLRSGRILLVNHVNPTYLTDPKDWNVRNNLMAMLSEDDGKTWIGGLMLDTRTGISYPDGVEDEEGRIYIVYDRDRTGAREILMAEFTEEDILEGRAASGAARLRVLINRAEGEKP
ncbi:MAG: exo-alpha-sialidase [Clostridia bacterium]|nr:exo-alpha-sialidase [Clostridia bacterium]